MRNGDGRLGFCRRKVSPLLVTVMFLAAVSFMSQVHADPSVRTIPYKISAQMWYAPLQSNAPRQLIATPQLIIKKIQQAFELWATVKEAGIQFRYDGLVNETYAGFHKIPQDGSVYIILNNWNIGQCADGLSQYWVDRNGVYLGGASVINTSKYAHSLSSNVLIHEIGHALGIVSHGASPGDIMSEAGNAWGVNEYYTLSEQDRADLIAVWNPQYQDLFTISGTVEAEPKDWLISIFAVNIRNGHAFSTKISHGEKFNLYLLKPGDYRIFTKAAEAYAYNKPASQSPSWYVADRVSTNDPYGGAVLHVDRDRRSIKGLSIKMIEKAVPFNLIESDQSYKKTGPFCFMRPGTSTTFSLEYTGIVSLEGYGEHPDYKFSDVALEPRFRQVTYAAVSVDAEAAPGERLVIARGRPGEMVQAGLIGVNVVTEIPFMLSPGDPKDTDRQASGK